MLESIHPDVTTYLSGSPKKLIIGGAQVPALSGKTFTAYNPSDGAALADVAAAGPEDVDRAVEAARPRWEMAGTGWRRRRGRRSSVGSVTSSGRTMKNWRNSNRWITASRSRTRRHIDARVAGDQIYHSAGLPTKIAGETRTVSIPDQFVYTRREPVVWSALSSRGTTR